MGANKKLYVHEFSELTRSLNPVLPLHHKELFRLVAYRGKDYFIPDTIEESKEYVYIQMMRVFVRMYKEKNMPVPDHPPIAGFFKLNEWIQ